MERRVQRVKDLFSQFRSLVLIPQACGPFKKIPLWWAECIGWGEGTARMKVHHMGSDTNRNQTSISSTRRQLEACEVTQMRDD